MGIHQYCKWLNGLDCKIESFDHTNYVYDYVYIDVNHILHMNLIPSTDINSYLTNIRTRIYQIVNNFVARKKFVFCLDGPAAYAKIVLQRKRRACNIATDIKSETLSPLHLTPGTPFMDFVGKFLSATLQIIQNNMKLLKTEFVVIGSNEPDEGEIKLFRQMQENVDTPNATHLVIGNDADLVVLAVATKIKNINVLIKYQASYMMVDIDRFVVHMIQNIMKINLDQFSDNCQKMIFVDNIRDDLSLLSLMLGNDYLPSVNLVNLNNVWNNYADVLKQTFKYNINNDESISVVQYSTLFDQKNKTFDRNFAIQFFLSYIRSSKINKYSKTFSYATFQTNYNKISNYISGLLWCHDMYSTGQCPQYDYIYNDAKRNPLELYYYFLCTQIMPSVVYNNTIPPPVKMYPMLVLPYCAKDLLYESQKLKMDAELKYLYLEEVCKICIMLKASIKKSNTTIRSSQAILKTLDDEKKINKLKNDVNEMKKNKAVLMEKLDLHKMAVHLADTFDIDSINNIINTCSDGANI